MSKKYTVGQVLFIISPKLKQVVPLQVSEIQTKETVEGEEIFYIVSDHSGEEYDLLDLEGEVFTDHKVVAKTLRENANRSIDKMVEVALSVARKQFGFKDQPELSLQKEKKPKKKKKEPEPQVQKTEIKPASGGDVLEVDSPNGPQKFKVRSVQMPEMAKG